jgi:hypothetical protein
MKIENWANKIKEELGKSGYIWQSRLWSKTGDRVKLRGAGVMISQGEVYLEEVCKMSLSVFLAYEI